MADEELRELERTWERTRTLADEVAFVRAQVRAGRVTAGGLCVAAALGHPAALELVPAPQRLQLRQALGRAGAVASARVAHSAASALRPRWSRARSYRARPEFEAALSATAAWAARPTAELGGAADAAAEALERLMGWAFLPGDDAEASHRRRVKASRQRASKPVERAAAAAIAAASTAGWAAIAPPERRDDSAADYACDAVGLASATLGEEAAREAVLSGVLSWLLERRVVEAMRPRRSRVGPAQALLQELRAVRGTDTPRFTAADALHPLRPAPSSAEDELGVAVRLVLQRMNANFKGGRLTPEHVAVAIRWLDRLPRKEGLTWCWIDAEELAPTPDGRATLALVVHDETTDEVRVCAYHRPRARERGHVWGYSSGGSPVRLELSTRSKASMIAVWSLLDGAKATAPIARAWANELVAPPG